jgi:hypothetical protein
MVSKRLRYEVLRRDDHACRYCGAMAPDVKLTIDHVVPVTLGGSDEPSNLVTACADCNAGKSSSSPDAPIVQDVAQDALRWARAMKVAGQLQVEDTVVRAAYVAAFDDAWSIWRYGDDSEVTRPPDWRSAIGRYHDAGLEIEVLTALVADVLPRKVSDRGMWPYFCGAVRNVMEQRREMAAQLIAVGGPFGD